MAQRKTKYYPIQASLKEEDFNEFERLRKVMGGDKEISKAEFIRQLMKVEIEDKREPKATRVYKRADPQLLYELNRWGNNLNQISRHCNEKKIIDIEVLKMLSRIEENLKVILPKQEVENDS